MSSLSRASILIVSGAVSWLVALSPVGDIAQAASLLLSISCGVAANQETKKLMWLEAKAKAQQVMQQELETIEMELIAQSQIEQLEAFYTPEVHEDLVEQLNHLYTAAPATTPPTTSTSTSSELKLAILALLESGKSKTYVIENILKMGGRNFEKGKQLLQQILEE